MTERQMIHSFGLASLLAYHRPANQITPKMSPAVTWPTEKSLELVHALILPEWAGG